ncbi:MAG TPA: isoamylase early set domain-containing protein, partial [Sedimentisphaerales bacterium]|nr:isoamylase early set domain-containing protein [Sedimentisphaerales bacterium]
QPISEYEPTSKGYKDFQALVTEIIGEDVKGQTKAMVDSLSRQLEAISVSANQLASAATPAQDVQMTSVPEAATMEEKLADFYGTRQEGEAVLFSTLYPRAQAVQLAGDFNGWKPEDAPLARVGENGVWQIKLPLGKGRYRYRLVVDGQWQQDPYNSNTEMNPYGECNSVVEVC